MCEFWQCKYFSKLNENFPEKFKYFNILKPSLFNNDKKQLQLIITKDDFVYYFDDNYKIHDRLIDLGQNINICEPTIIYQLCKKQIIEFNNGVEQYIARSIYGKLYSFESINDDIKLNEIEINDNVVEVSCGVIHTIVLTQNGEVYGWGHNRWGQIGINTKEEFISKPTKIGFNGEKIQSISCGSYHSMALTLNGNVFSWGYNSCGQLGISSYDDSMLPQMIVIKDNKQIFTKISCGSHHSLLLSTNGDIYTVGLNQYSQLGNKILEYKQFIPKKVEMNPRIEFSDICCYFYDDFSTALSLTDGYCYIWGNCKKKGIIEFPVKTNYNNCEDAVFNISGYTVRAFCPLLSYKNFEHQNIISIGGHGIVNCVFDIRDENLYAMKRIAFNNLIKDKVLKEVYITKQLKSDFVIEIKDIWIEDNYILNENKDKYRTFCRNIDKHKLFSTDNNLLLHVQTELCFKTLKDVLFQIRNELNEGDFEIKSFLSFYISSELFYEILECVDFIHSKKPNPVIHRDLKPSNILITFGINGRFVKLGDFGLSKEVESLSQTNTSNVGTVGYIAPEVRGRKYSTKVDVWSLGAFIEQIYNFDINNLKIENIENAELRTLYTNVTEIQNKMIAYVINDRIDCKQVLENKNQWRLSLEQIKCEEKYKELIKIREPKIESNFCSFFITKRIFHN